jgi:HEAT repeat protein
VNDAGPVARAAELATLGHHAPLDAGARERLLVALAADPDARVRAAALGALVRAADDDATAAWLGALRDGDAAVRRRAAEVAPHLPADARVAPALLEG